MNDFISKVESQAEALQTLGSLAGYAAHAAVNELLANWREAVTQGTSIRDLARDLLATAKLLEGAAEAIVASGPPPVTEYVIGALATTGERLDDWDERLRTTGASPVTTRKRIVATFHPQRWVNDNACPADPLGPTTWDVTDEIYALGRVAALKLRDNDYATDELRHSANAPLWIENWEGPFYVSVEFEISDFWDVESANG